MSTDWTRLAAEEIVKNPIGVEDVAETIRKYAPSTPLLICVDCKNTESPAGAKARYFNHGRCLHCGGPFEVLKA